MVPVSLRMKKIADMVSAKSVADIGCDHGYISIYLVTQKGIDHAIAMDINEGPLSRAKEHVMLYGLSDKIETRLSDGAQALDMGEVNGTVIAGMGGRLTERIIGESAEIFKAMDEIILSPQSEIDHVRRYLVHNGFEICDEDMVYDESKYYTIIKCAYNENMPRTISDTDAMFGPVLIRKKHPVFIEYLNDRIKKLEEIRVRIDSGANTESERGAMRTDQLDGETELIRQLLRKLQD